MIRQDWSTLKKLMFMKTAAGGGAAVEATATGNPLTFQTDLVRPLKSLLIPFTPVQSGTGDPSPQNIRSILPWNGLTVFGGGKNLFKLVESEMVSVGWNRFFPNPINKAGTYTISCQHPFGGTGNQGARVVLTNDDDSSAQEIKLLTAWTFGQSSAGSKATFTLTEEEAQCEYIWFQCAGASTGFDQFENAELQIEAGQTATAYEPFEPITETSISFPSPVYGGTLDVVSGALTVEWALFTAKWKNGTDAGDLGNNVRKKFIMPVSFVNASSIPSAYCDTAKWRWDFESDNIHFYSNGNASYVFLPEETDGETEINIVGKLATPQEITLTPEQITALKGNNTIWSDADGSMTATYLKKG